MSPNRLSTAAIISLSFWAAQACYGLTPALKSPPLPVNCAALVRNEGAKALPGVPLTQVHIALKRTGGKSAGPSYSIDLYGDGRVVYSGSDRVDVEGVHTYRVPQKEIAQLVRALSASELWSLAPVQRGDLSEDTRGAVLTLNLGKESHQLAHLDACSARAPSELTQFEYEIDKVARSGMWAALSLPALQYLEAERFDFASRAGADLLARAMQGRRAEDEKALLHLIELGAPSNGVMRSGRDSSLSPIESALLMARPVLIDALIARGALESDGKRDQEKIDKAFLAAIASGRLALVQKMWAIGGARPHPATRVELSYFSQGVRSRGSYPVTFMMARYADEKGRPAKWRTARNEGPWEGLAITKFLAAQGCDLKARGPDGRTLMHIAAKAGDAELVRYLLDQGLSPLTSDERKQLAVDVAHREEVARQLYAALEAVDRN